jgi:hypothetical protein
MSASDTTQAALVEILHHNPIGGFAYDSEIDTMVQGNAKKDFGGFSDIIRKVFHHEPLNRQRKGEGESYQVMNPRLAVMLSGTIDQLKKLISSEANGLFSRFWYYHIPPSFTPYTMPGQQRDIVGDKCTRLQSEVNEAADLWSDELIYISFTAAQEQELCAAMQDKIRIQETYGGDIGASWLRMGLIIKRIAVTLAAFDGAAGQMPEMPWRAAMGMLPTMKAHCIKALEVIRERTKGRKDISREDYERMKGQGKTEEEIADALGVTRKTLLERRKEWGMGKETVTHGKYRVDAGFDGMGSG